MLFPEFCVEGLLKILDFIYYVLIGGKVIKKQKQKNVESELQELVYFDRTTKCMFNYQIWYFFQLRSQLQLI